MQITDRNLKSFETWMLERGRAEVTANAYMIALRKCASSSSLTTRLISDDLAPKSKRTNLAALKAWATFTEDETLLKRLKNIRLPPANRLRPKIPLTPEDWRRFVAHVQKAKGISIPMRAVILIMALRGLRSGDALRIRRKEIVDALGDGKLSFLGKGKKRHEFSIVPIKRELEDLKAQHGWDHVRDLFGEISDKAVSNKVARAVKRCGKQLKIDGVHPHRLRRTVAMMFLEKIGPDPQAIPKLQSFMGWSNAATALGYVDAVNKAELDQIGNEMVADLLK